MKNNICPGKVFGIGSDKVVVIRGSLTADLETSFPSEYIVLSLLSGQYKCVKSSLLVQQIGFEPELLYGEENVISPDTISYREGVFRLRGGVWHCYYVKTPWKIENVSAEKLALIKSKNPRFFMAKDEEFVCHAKTGTSFYELHLTYVPRDMKECVLSWLKRVLGLEGVLIEAKGPDSLWFK